MSHRINNNIGYKKIYPMSLWEDNSFCHYCGRTADPTLQLEWDHVPALNVKIPEDYQDIRKTLVRSCHECNSIASDIPHLDYLERHLWLKAAYLRRYKRLIVSDGDFATTVSSNDSYLNGVINNSKEKYLQILNAIGFGIKNIDQIDSPILEVRTKSGRKIANVLIEYLSGVPTEEEEDEIESIEVDSNNIEEAEDLGFKPYSLKEFIDFLIGEYESGNFIQSHDHYRHWYKAHPDRATCLELPEVPHKHIGVSWERLVEMVLEEAEPLDAEQRYLEDREQCSLETFIHCIKYEIPYEYSTSEQQYQSWLRINSYYADVYSLPFNVCENYGINWDEILKYRVKPDSKPHHEQTMKKELSATSLKDLVSSRNSNKKTSLQSNQVSLDKSVKTFKDKQRVLYEMYGKRYYIKAIDFRLYVNYTCPTHGVQKDLLDEMLNGICCCNRQDN
ncbi:hypothetical protein M5237_002915 [Vibrio parahaemolyticus]|uniref:hypothetical protein n=1 Tax=Vibrio tubiashii TaxID=29498 RepID=UPI0034DBEEDC|nr:hypothetical protein [Vibrio parahaemolyticus]